MCCVSLGHHYWPSTLRLEDGKRGKVAVPFTEITWKYRGKPWSFSHPLYRQEQEVTSANYSNGTFNRNLSRVRRCFRTTDDPGTAIRVAIDWTTASYAGEIMGVASVQLFTRSKITVQLLVILLRNCEVLGFDSNAGRRLSQQLFRGRPHFNKKIVIMGKSTLKQATTAYFHVQIHHNRFTCQRKI
jgi:hypothetical protein